MASNFETINVNDIDHTFSKYADLASKRQGSRVIAVSDEFFAKAENLINPEPPMHKPNFYIDTGAWYDGWETRRHNVNEYDWVIIKLGPGHIAGIELDTTFFNGNHAPEISVLGCDCSKLEVHLNENDGHFNEEGTTIYETFSRHDLLSENSKVQWQTILPRQECKPSSRHAWKFDRLTKRGFTHVKLQMYPDGGIARFRVYGEMNFDQSSGKVMGMSIINLASSSYGAKAIKCSNQHFGTMSNLLLLGRGFDMRDGWETKRTRGEHIDWVIIKLGSKGYIDHLLIDTKDFKGNFPQFYQVFGTCLSSGDEPNENDDWTEILPKTKGEADCVNWLSKDQLMNVVDQVYSHVKLVIIPDGGIKRFKVLGRPAE